MAAAVILSLNNNNPISNAKKATYQSDLKGYASELELYKSNQLLSSSGSFNPDTLEKSTYSGTGDTVGTIKEVFPNMKQEYASVFRIQGGKLLYVGGEQVHVVWLQEIDIPVQMVVIDEASKQIIGVRDFAYIYGTLEIPDYIESITPNAFYNNQGLVKVDFSKNTKIKEIPAYAFSKCRNLEKIIFPESLEIIGMWSFADCYKLNNVVIPDSVHAIQTYAFYNCGSLDNFKFPNNNRFKNITYACFANTNISDLDIPNSVNLIEAEAFSGCNVLTSVRIGGSVSGFAGAFANSNNLKDITIDMQNPNFSSHDGAIYSKDYTKFVQCPPAKEQIKFHEKITTINSMAFRGCNNLKTLNIPASVTNIESSQFITCKSLSSLTVDSANLNYTSENNILYDKQKTRVISAANTNENIVFPASVKYINGAAFEAASKLKSVDMSNTRN